MSVSTMNWDSFNDWWKTEFDMIEHVIRHIESQRRIQNREINSACEIVSWETIEIIRNTIEIADE